MTNPTAGMATDEMQVAYLYSLAHLASLSYRTALKFKKAFPTHDSWSSVPVADRQDAARLISSTDATKIAAMNFDGLLDRALEEIREHERQGIRVLSIDSPSYPELLRQIADPPLVLFVKGSVESINGGSNVAVVGTRDSTPTGEKVATKVAKWLGEQNWCVVSGLAKGIDAAAHRGAVEGNARTVAVMATPLDKVYPAENRELADCILESGGSWISETPICKKFHRGAFVQRDRIQSGISVAVIPVQTDVEGGTMHTVRYAEQQKRLVLCPQPLEQEQLQRQYAGIRLLISSGRASVFTNKEYAKILETLSAYRNKLLHETPPQSTPFLQASVIGTREEAIRSLEDRRTDVPVSKKLFATLQSGFAFADDIVAVRSRNSQNKKETNIELRLLQELRDEIDVARLHDGTAVNSLDDVKQWFEDMIRTLRKRQPTFDQRKKK